MKKNIFEKIDSFKDKVVVITYGTYDLFHFGHDNILKRAKEEGDILIVAVSTDEFNELKGKKSHQSFEERLNQVSKADFVDFVIPEVSWEQKSEDVKKFHVDKLVMGSDWKGKFDSLEEQGVEVIIKDRTEGISSTILREKIDNKQS